MQQPTMPTEDEQAIAHATEAWARKHKCVRTEDGITGYFTVKPGVYAEQREDGSEHRPVWQDQFKGEDWETTLNTLLRLGIPISIEASRGWYIGYPGDEANIFRTRIHHDVTHMDGTMHLFANSFFAGKLETISSGINLSPDKVTVDIHLVFKAMGMFVANVNNNYQPTLFDEQIYAQLDAVAKANDEDHDGDEGDESENQ